MNTTKIIFLDFDGVLLPEDSERTQIQNGLTRDNYLEQVIFDKQCVVNLNELLARSGAEIVLSTSWAWQNPFKDLCDCLLRNKIDPSKLFEWDDPDSKNYMTPRGEDSNRENEIGWWIDAHPQIEEWVAVDNIQAIRSLGMRAVVTDPAIGFNTECLNQALEILTK